MESSLAGEKESGGLSFVFDFLFMKRMRCLRGKGRESKEAIVKKRQGEGHREITSSSTGVHSVFLARAEEGGRRDIIALSNGWEECGRPTNLLILRKV